MTNSFLVSKFADLFLQNNFSFTSLCFFKMRFRIGFPIGIWGCIQDRLGEGPWPHHVTFHHSWACSISPFVPVSLSTSLSVWQCSPRRLCPPSALRFSHCNQWCFLCHALTDCDQCGGKPRMPSVLLQTSVGPPPYYCKFVSSLRLFIEKIH